MAVTTTLTKRVSDAFKDRLYFNQRNRDQWIEDIARQLEPGTRVLDAGAGDCPYRSLFRHCEYRTQDFCQYEGTRRGPVRDTWRYGQIDHISDITSIPVDDESFDVVICSEVLEHVPHPVAAIGEIARVVRPGGKVFISAPLGSGLHQQPYHYYGGFTPHFYRRFLPPAGLRVERVTPDGGFFRHLLQEISRASSILIDRKDRRKWDPRSLVNIFIAKVVVPLWLTSLDDRVFVEEFTVGYFVEAQKHAALASSDFGLAEEGIREAR